MHPQRANIVIEKTNIVMESTIKIKEDDNIETKYKTPAKKKAKRTRKIKPLPEELAGLKDCATDWEKFTVAKEADGNNKSEQSGKELAAVQSVHVIVK
jgi:hypothetical protein